MLPPMRRRLLLLLLAVALGATLAVSPGVASGPARAQAGSSGPVPTVTGPLTGGRGQPVVLATTFDLSRFGYLQEEYLLAGEATAYAAAAPLGPDGRWSVTPASRAPYTTRIVVNRPAGPKDFDGTVVVEWLNVTAGADAGPGWILSHLELLRSGAAWVGVTAQAVGVRGTAGDGGLRAADPERYAALAHPGDSYSYDIYTQAARAVRGEANLRPLGPLAPRRLLAHGESQSASRMVTYLNAVHPLARVFDGFLVHSRFGSSAPLSQPPQESIPAPLPALIRADTREPVLVFQTETDVGPLGSAASRQPDTRRLRTWEIAGTAHADAYYGPLGFTDVGDGRAEVALLDYTNPSRGVLNCEVPVNAGPHYAHLMAAFRHLDRWVRTGTPPPKSPQLVVTAGPGRQVGGQTVPNFVITRDERGIAVGGIRNPIVDAPLAAVTGEFNTGGSFCNLFGVTTPFDAATVAALYPSRAQYQAAFAKATRRAVKGGFLLREEAKKLLAAIEQVPYPG